LIVTQRAIDLGNADRPGCDQARLRRAIASQTEIGRQYVVAAFYLQAMSRKKDDPHISGRRAATETVNDAFKFRSTRVQRQKDRESAPSQRIRDSRRVAYCVVQGAYRPIIR
jgi:hypothetical protein